MTLSNRAVIICGQPKAGTTSLHYWLSQHPEIRNADKKEVRFFLDKDYPIPKGSVFDGKNEKLYLDLFSKFPKEGVLLDSSPDYLYSKNALHNFDVLPNALLVFIHRDPVDRIISWFRFCKSIGRIEPEMEFENFIKAQSKLDYRSQNIAFYGLEHSRFEYYVAPFLEKYGNRVMVLNFQDLKNSPQNVVMQICKACDIDSSFYNDFSFNSKNETSSYSAKRISRVYFELRAFLIYKTPFPSSFWRILRPIGYWFKRFTLGRVRNDKITPTREVVEIIREFSKK